MGRLKKKLREPQTATFVCCFLVGIIGVSFVFVGIGGGFLKPVGYKLDCNVTTAARLTCVAAWDKIQQAVDCIPINATANVIM